MALSNRTSTRFNNWSDPFGFSGTHTPTGTPDAVFALVLSYDTLGGLTYGGASMTQIATHDMYSAHVYVFYLGSPAAGAQTVATVTPSGTITAWVVTYTGVDVGGTPYGVLDNWSSDLFPTSYSRSITSASDREVLGLAHGGDGTFTRGGSQTGLASAPAIDSGNFRSADAWYAAGTLTTATGNNTASVEGTIIIDVRPSGGGGGPSGHINLVFRAP
jgi:hypothetical protein